MFTFVVNIWMLFCHMFIEKKCLHIVLILNGNLEIAAHIRNYLWNLICLRHLIRSGAVSNRIFIQSQSIQQNTRGSQLQADPSGLKIQGCSGTPWMATRQDRRHPLYPSLGLALIPPPPLSFIFHSAEVRQNFFDLPISWV